MVIMYDYFLFDSVCMRQKFCNLFKIIDKSELEIDF